jgi:hypothetical protein
MGCKVNDFGTNHNGTNTKLTSERRTTAIPEQSGTESYYRTVTADTVEPVIMRI